MRVAGIDGLLTPRGWVTVVLEEGKLHLVRLAMTLDEALEESGDARVVAVNLPLGHDDPDGTQGGLRRCDAAAREYLGANAAQLAPVPPFDVFQASDLDTAVARAEARALPRPAAGLWRVRERIPLVQSAHAQDPRLHEVHGELSFTALLRAHEGTDAMLRHTRIVSVAARHERLALLHRAGLRPARSVGGIGRLNPEDVLVATVAAWSAQRIAEREALAFPEVPDVPRLYA